MNAYYDENDPLGETPPPRPSEQFDEKPSQEARQWAMFCHLGALAGLTGIPLVGLIVPLVLWQMKKEEHPFVDDQGKESVNFQITLYVILAGLLLFTLVTIGFGAFLAVPVLIIGGIASIILEILAGVKANDGEVYRYPINFRFIK